jgi:hypothetical protein
MSENQPTNSFLYFSTNKGSRLTEGFYPVNDEFLHIFACKETSDLQHPVRIQFGSRIPKLFGKDYAHFSICLTKGDAEKLQKQLSDIIETLW